ncbi:hypothetical protein [Nocardiopsis sp. CNR-923]|uniref:hypothetical protein n=1 Tax=Nocardiopsis sp. CNR-923 TaxID=1904965 RepID=UPI001300D58A|nr:hypothetical protein [Nocardiopsis sp. CNR-923]
MTKDSRAELRLAPPEIEAAEAAHPSGERMLRGNTATGFRVPLADVTGSHPP